MKTSSVLCALGVLLSIEVHATTIRSYYIGNSVTDTIRYDSLRQLAEGKGHANVWGRHVILGAPLDLLWNTPSSGFQQPPYGYPTNALPYYTWDVLSLQPFDRSLTSDTNSISNFITLGLPRNSNMQVYVYSRWPRQEHFFPDYDTTWLTNNPGFNESRVFFEAVCCALREQWVTNITLPVRIVPCGDVLYALNQKMKTGQIPGFSTIVQVYADGIHLNSTGAYAVACTFFATMYKESPIGLNSTLYGISDTALARMIETTVWEVVSTHQYAGVMPEILPMAYRVTVPEGGTATLRIRLTDPPAAATTVNVARVAGDADITSSSVVVFTPANHAAWQTVTLAAAEDGDWLHGNATIQCSGPGVAACQFTAHELDNDAAAVCYDPFDTPPRILHDARTGYGWNSAWQAEGGSSSIGYKIVYGSLSFGRLVTKGRKAEGGYAYQGLGRSFDLVNAFQPWVSNMGGVFIGKAGTELWISYLCRLAATTYHGKVWLDDAGGAYHDNNGILRVNTVHVPGRGRVWMLSAMKEAFAVTSNVPVTTNVTLFVLRIQFGATTHQVDLFINPPVLGGTPPAQPDATLVISSAAFRFADLGWNPDSGAASGWLDELRFGNSFANVTPAMATVFTNNNNIVVNGRLENDERSGDIILFTGMISGTGTFVEATGLTNTFVGVISPGFSPGTLIFNQATGTFLFGTPAEPCTLHIENGDMLVFTNLTGPADLSRINVTFFSPSTYDATNWFLFCASGISNEFNATNFVMYTSGHLVYDYAAGKAGVWIIPEPALCTLLCGGLAWKLSRRSTSRLC